MKWDKDAFWTLIQEAKEHCGQDIDAHARWLKEKLVELGPEQAQNFHDVMHGYLDLAYKYGLWDAGSIMCEYGCTDDGFIDFRAWIIAQGKEVYFAALKDPDSLADVPAYGGCYYETLCYVGDYAYQALTGKSAYDCTDRTAERKLREMLRQDIVYGEGIGYPYGGRDIPAYLPRLCSKYDVGTKLWMDIWNRESPNILRAMQQEKKHKRVEKKRGDCR